jgi:hypothetical protein
LVVMEGAESSVFRTFLNTQRERKAVRSDDCKS